MTDRLKTVYPPKTSFCGGYKQYTPLKLRFAGGIKTVEAMLRVIGQDLPATGLRVKIGWAATT